MQLNNHQLLRFTRAGCVDNGKSTLTGRLVYDLKSIFEDQLVTIENISKKKGHDGVDLAFLPLRWSFYLTGVFWILIFGLYGENTVKEFIYSQF